MARQGGDGVTISSSREAREVMVALEDMKFSAAHFVAFRGFREPLHGHNYTVAVRIGGGSLQADGYLTDFGDLKQVTRQACKRLNQRTLVPMRSDVMRVEVHDAASTATGSHGRQVVVRCEGGVTLSFPEVDCALLPIVHSTAEELAEHLWWDILVNYKLAELLSSRGVQWMEVSVSERPGQGAQYRNDIEVTRTQASPFAATPQSSDASAGGTVSALRPAPTRRFVPRPCFGQEDMDEGDIPPPPSPHPVLPYGGTRRLHLRQPPVVSPMPQHLEAAQLDPVASPVAVAEAAYRMLLSTLGPDESSRAALERTPYRAAKAFREMTAGLNVENPLTAVGQGIFDVDEAQDLVAIRDLPFHSMCEHHLLPFSGVCHVAYFPQGKVLGLSKFPRLLQVFARRLQLQERLTSQYADAIERILAPRALAVALEATHGCMCHRGVGVASSTRTLVVRGPGRTEPDLRGAVLDGVSFSSGARARL
mmetsp:Transcript_5050/g.14344  ORF Transcript_5050/g.14344 Transcript_5050/m.14344 type:complete len:479 (+) Transcript_5050:92-1528(+)